MYRVIGLVAVSCFPALLSGAVRLQEQTSKAFDGYINEVEASMRADVAAGHPAALDRIPGAKERVHARSGRKEVLAVPFPHRKAGEDARIEVPQGLINHWLGAVFIPGASVADVRAVLEDYPNYSRYYAPDVTESKLLSRNGENLDVFLRLHRQVRIKVMFGYGFPVEFNARYNVQYTNGNNLLRLRSISTRIAQVRDPDKSHTDEYPVDDGDGYLWRLYSYWRIYPANSQGVSGVYVESEAVSLSRSVPGFVERMVTYFTSNFPRESMQSTLDKTRLAVQGRMKAK